ncbi:hypothetical protein, partial [Serratia marcescens]|uniref:hypothetical protein n=1 Tax=Serratia marcescens TaxID=615 RepID=UPI002FDA0EE5
LLQYDCCDYFLVLRCFLIKKRYMRYGNVFASQKVYFIYNDINSSALASTQKQDAGKHRVLQGNGLP